MPPKQSLLGARYSWDRLLIVGVILLATVPLVIYVWVALNADREARVDTAQARNLSTAQLISGTLDRQCEGATAALHELSQRIALADAMRRKDAAALGARLDDLRKSDSDIDLASAYSASGDLLASRSAAGTRPAAAQHRGWARDFSRSSNVHSATEVFRTADGATILLGVPVRDSRGFAGFVVAGIDGSRIDSWLRTIALAGSIVYIADSGGHVVAGTCSPVIRQLPLDGYEPMRYALNAQQGVMLVQSPDSVEDHLVGYCPARISRCGVVVTQPMDVAFQATNFLALRLSVLLLPVIALAGTGAWHRLRFTRQVEAMARRLAEQNEGLRAADKAKSEFLAQVSHDLRTPLAAMHVSLSGLLDPEEEWSEEKVRDSLAVVNSEVGHLTARVQALLDMARLEAGMGGAERELRDLTDIVAGALERIEPLLRGRRIDEQFPDEPLLVECDQGEIEKVVVNLLENAAKYSPAGSTIHISGWRTTNDERPTTNAEAIFTVRDEGPGLAEGDEERVFEKFFRGERTRRVRGTGLGLSICKAIIEAHGGRIGARRGVGSRVSGVGNGSGPDTQGAEFWFSLPLVEMGDLQEDPDNRPVSVIMGA